VYNTDEIVLPTLSETAASCTFDSTLTMAIAKTNRPARKGASAWYDNEWGYSNPPYRRRQTDRPSHERFVVTRSVPLLEDLGDLDGKSVSSAWISTSRSRDTQRANRVVADDFRIRAALPTLFWAAPTTGLASPPVPTSAGPRARLIPKYDMDRSGRD